MPKIKKPIAKVANKVHYDIFSKSRGYICTATDEADARDALQDLFVENDRFWRKEQSEGKKWKRFDCYCLVRDNNKSEVLPFSFDDGSDEEEEYFEGDANVS